MLGQDYRLFKTVKKGKGTKGSTGRLSNTSDNVYESPYDEVNTLVQFLWCFTSCISANILLYVQGIAEVFGIYATLKPASVEFRTSLRKVIYTYTCTI